MGNQVGLPQDESVKWPGKKGDFILDSEVPTTISNPSSSHYSIMLHFKKVMLSEEQARDSYLMKTQNERKFKTHLAFFTLL